MSSWCSLIVLCFGSVAAVSSIALLAIAVTTDHWMETAVDREALASNHPLALESNQFRYFTRSHGLFRTCFPDTTRPLEGLYLSPVEEWCSTSPHWTSSSPTTNNLHLHRATPILLLLSLATLSASSLVGLSGCWSQCPTRLMTMAVFQLAAAAAGAASMATWHAANFLENNNIKEEGNDEDGFLRLLVATQSTVGWSYCVAWAGIALSLVSCLAISTAALTWRSQRNIWKENNGRMEINRPVVYLSSCHNIRTGHNMLNCHELTPNHIMPNCHKPNPTHNIPACQDTQICHELRPSQSFLPGCQLTPYQNTLPCRGHSCFSRQCSSLASLKSASRDSESINHERSIKQNFGSFYSQESQMSERSAREGRDIIISKDIERPVSPNERFAKQNSDRLAIHGCPRPLSQNRQSASLSRDRFSSQDSERSERFSNQESQRCVGQASSGFYSMSSSASVASQETKIIARQENENFKNLDSEHFSRTLEQMEQEQKSQKFYDQNEQISDKWDTSRIERYNKKMLHMLKNTMHSSDKYIREMLEF